MRGSLRKLMPDPTLVSWVDFPPNWFSYFWEATGIVFNYPGVNGKCTLVAHKLRLYYGRGVERYGHYRGPVTNPHWVKPVIQHGWLEIDGIVADPARWCFYAGHKPQLALASVSCPDYDVGGNQHRAENRQPMPEYDGRAVGCDCKLICGLFENQVSAGRLFWLANLAPSDPIFGGRKNQVAMFRWMQRSGYEAFIPIDNQVK